MTPEMPEKQTVPASGVQIPALHPHRPQFRPKSAPAARQHSQPHPARRKEIPELTPHEGSPHQTGSILLQTLRRSPSLWPGFPP